jgi:hypothetical protein
MQFGTFKLLHVTFRRAFHQPSPACNWNDFKLIRNYAKMCMPKSRSIRHWHFLCPAVFCANLQQTLNPPMLESERGLGTRGHLFADGSVDLSCNLSFTDWPCTDWLYGQIWLVQSEHQFSSVFLIPVCSADKDADAPAPHTRGHGASVTSVLHA